MVQTPTIYTDKYSLQDNKQKAKTKKIAAKPTPKKEPKKEIVADFKCEKLLKGIGLLELL